MILWLLIFIYRVEFIFECSIWWLKWFVVSRNIFLIVPLGKTCPILYVIYNQIFSSILSISYLNYVDICYGTIFLFPFCQTRCFNNLKLFFGRRNISFFARNTSKWKIKMNKYNIYVFLYQHIMRYSNNTLHLQQPTLTHNIILTITFRDPIVKLSTSTSSGKLTTQEQQQQHDYRVFFKIPSHTL